MNEQVDRIQRHLYRRRYETSSGDSTTLYYAAFKDWKGRRRKFYLGSELKTAREELTVLESRNIRREDFDQGQVQQLTFSAWAKRYLELMESKKSWDRDRQHCQHLCEFFGRMPLSTITRTKVMEYKNLRLKSFIVRHGKPVAGRTVAEGTVRLELACLKAMLNLASDEGLIDSVPRIKTGPGTARERVLFNEEYEALLSVSPRWLARVEIAAYETAMSKGDLLALTWPQVDEKAGLIRVRGGRKKTGVRQIAPITHELRKVLAGLHMEQKKIASIGDCVFTRDGQSIGVSSLRKAFEKALRTAGISDFHFHDFRHTAKTRWSAMGIPAEASMLASGQKTPGMHMRYINLQEDQLKQAFKPAIIPPQFPRKYSKELATDVTY